MLKLMVGVHLITGFLLFIYMVSVCTFVYIRLLNNLRTNYKFPRCWDFINEKVDEIWKSIHEGEKYSVSIWVSFVLSFVGGYWWPFTFYSCVLSKKLALSIYKLFIKNLLYSACLSKEERAQIALGTNNTIEEPRG